jgi:hypothetical protein
MCEKENTITNKQKNKKTKKYFGIILVLILGLSRPL